MISFNAAMEGIANATGISQGHLAMENGVPVLAKGPIGINCLNRKALLTYLDQHAAYIDQISLNALSGLSLIWGSSVVQNNAKCRDVVNAHLVRAENSVRDRMSLEGRATWTNYASHLKQEATNYHLTQIIVRIAESEIVQAADGPVGVPNGALARFKVDNAYWRAFSGRVLNLFFHYVLNNFVSAHVAPKEKQELGELAKRFQPIHLQEILERAPVHPLTFSSQTPAQPPCVDGTKRGNQFWKIANKERRRVSIKAWKPLSDTYLISQSELYYVGSAIACWKAGVDKSSAAAVLSARQIHAFASSTEDYVLIQDRR